MDYQRNYVFLYSENATLRLWILLICVLLLMTMYTSVVLFGQQLVRYEEAQKRRLLETQVDAMRHEIAELKDIYGDIRGLRHDLSNHIEGLLAIVGEKTAATEYLRRMQGTVDRLSPRFRTGDPIIDMLLSRQALAAERAGIRFEADVFVPPSGKPDAYDLGIVLGNAIDNAIEAVVRSRLSDGYVRVESYRRGSLYFLEVTNVYDGVLSVDPRTEMPISRKPDGARHGLGIANIRRCAEKYKGTAEWTTEEVGGEHRFTLTVMMVADG